METNYSACLLLAAVGDTIGFFNGKIEYNETPANNRNLKDIKSRDFLHSTQNVFFFMSLGGINNINLKGWIVSDDTIMQMATASAFIDKKKYVKKYDSKKIIDQVIDNYFDEFKKRSMVSRFPGTTIQKSINRLQDELNRKYHDIEYDFYAGGSGCSMRTACIGLVFNEPKDFKKLLQISLEVGRITHSNSISYLGGFVSAFFTSLAVQKVPIEKWPFKLIELDNKDVFGKYIKSKWSKIEYVDFLRDKDRFFDKWKIYIEDRFDKKKPIQDSSVGGLHHPHMVHPYFRSKYYWKTFGWKKQAEPNVGSGGDDSVIVAYDCLIDAGKCWEKLVIYAMLHSGDSDTTGSIAGAWYGILYGTENVPGNMVEHLELKEEINYIGSELYNLYYNK
jgi:ADP-ribosylarginine hydrolase